MVVTRPCCAPCRLFALPGVPAEMFEMWETSVAPAVAAAHATRRVIRHRRIKCFGVGESDLEAMLPDMIRRGRDPLVGVTVSGATITLRLTATGASEAACYRAMEPTIAQIRDLLGTIVFGEEEDELQHAVVRLLNERQQSLAIAEWATDGLISHWIAEAAGGSDCFLGGIDIPSAAALRSLLGVMISAEQGGDAETARAMANAVRDRTGADYGLAVAAFPSADSVLLSSDLPREPSGKLQMALASSDGVQVKSFSLASHPSIIEVRAAKQALEMVRLHILRPPPSGRLSANLPQGNRR